MNIKKGEIMYNLIFTDGYNIEATTYNSLLEAQEAMQKAFNDLMPTDGLIDEYEDSTFISDTQAALYRNGEDVFIWNIQKINAEPVKKMVTFSRNYVEVYSHKDEDVEKNALMRTTIDGFPVDDNENGKTIANVWMTMGGEIVVDWHDYAYLNNENVNQLINEAIGEMLSQRYENAIKYYKEG